MPGYIYIGVKSEMEKGNPYIRKHSMVGKGLGTFVPHTHI